MCGEVVQDKYEAGAFSDLTDDKMRNRDEVVGCSARRSGFDGELVNLLNPVHGSRGWTVTVYNVYHFFLGVKTADGEQ